MGACVYVYGGGGEGVTALICVRGRNEAVIQGY